MIVTEFDQYNQFRVDLHAVDSLNVNHELRLKTCRHHADISKRYFAICHLKIVFYFLHDLSKGQGVVTSLDGINGLSNQTLLRE